MDIKSEQRLLTQSVMRSTEIVDRKTAAIKETRELLEKEDAFEPRLDKVRIYIVSSTQGNARLYVVFQALRRRAQVRIFTSQQKCR